MGNFGVLGQAVVLDLVYFGVLWDSLGYFGGTLGELWCTLEYFGVLWGILGRFEKLSVTLGNFGVL